MAFTYDGAELTGLEITGSAAGAFTFGYDGNGFLTSSKLVSGAQTLTTALIRDKDGRLTGDGPFASPATASAAWPARSPAPA